MGEEDKPRIRRSGLAILMPPDTVSPEEPKVEKCLRCGHLAIEIEEDTRICLCTATGQVPLLEKTPKGGR